jgi:hypothetical protein
MRKPHSEHFSTAVPQKADVVLNAANGSFVPILLQKSAITMREDCLDLLTRLPTMPLLASGSAPTRDLAPLWLGKACIERWWRSSDQFCEAA